MSDLNVNEIAQRAYALFREKDTKAPAWADLQNNYKWEDLTRSFVHNPRALPAHFGEECVVKAIGDARIAAESKPAPIIEPVVIQPETPAEVAADKAKPAAKKPAKK